MTVAGEPAQPARHELERLRVFALNHGKLLTKRMSVREVRVAGDGIEGNLLHVNICKIERDRARPRTLLSEPGAGYRLVDPATHA